MKIIRHSFVDSLGGIGEYASKTFPSAIRLKSGRLLCGFRAAPKKSSEVPQHAVFCYSDDGGITWSGAAEPVKAFDLDGVSGQVRGIYFAEYRGELVALLNWVDESHPELPFYRPENEGLKDFRIFMTRSEDGGRSWSSPMRVPTSPIETPTPLTGAPVSLNDGRLMIPFEVNKSYYDEAEWIHQSCALFYDGESFTPPVVITEEPKKYYWDQRVTRLSGSNLIDVFWSYDGVTGQYLNVHAKLSDDNGQTWGQLRDLGMGGQPGYGAWSNGVFYLPVINRDGAPKILLYASKDLVHYTEELVVYESGLVKQTDENVNMEEAWSEMGKFSVGHPQALQLAENELVVYFYAGSETDRTDIQLVNISI